MRRAYRKVLFGLLASIALSSCDEYGHVQLGSYYKDDCRFSDAYSIFVGESNRRKEIGAEFGGSLLLRMTGYDRNPIEDAEESLPLEAITPFFESASFEEVETPQNEDKELTHFPEWKHYLIQIPNTGKFHVGKEREYPYPCMLTLAFPLSPKIETFQISMWQLGGYGMDAIFIHRDYALNNPSSLASLRKACAERLPSN